MDIKLLNEELDKDEEVRAFAYDDSTGKQILPGQTLHGKLTIGVGRNLTSKGVHQDEIDLMLNNDVLDAMADVSKHLPWWVTLNDARQRALCNMCFNLGIGGLIKFDTFLSLLQQGKYPEAADDLLNTAAAREAVARYQRLSLQIRNGV